MAEKKRARRIIKKTGSQPEFEGQRKARSRAAIGKDPLGSLEEFDRRLLQTFTNRKRRGRNFATILGIRRFPTGTLRLNRRTLLGGAGRLGV